MIAFVLIGLVVAVLLAGAVLVASPAPAAATSGACQSAAGVTVVIDFGDLAGLAPVTPTTVVACAPGPVDTGFGALTAAGVGYQSTTRSPGFLCRIDGKPSNDQCLNPSPATAYWSYWLAVRGGPWCVSPVGAGNRKPPAGTVEGWVFEHDPSGEEQAHAPQVAPPPPLVGVAPASLSSTDCVSTAPTTTTTSTSTTVVSTSSGGGTGTGSIGTPTTKPAKAGSTVDPSPTGSTVTNGQAPDAGATTTTTSGGSATVAAGPTDGGASAVDLSGGGGGGGPIGAIVTGGMLTAIAAAALLLRRRRRTQSSIPPHGEGEG